MLRASEAGWAAGGVAGRVDERTTTCLTPTEDPKPWEVSLPLTWLLKGEELEEGYEAVRSTAEGSLEEESVPDGRGALALGWYESGGKISMDAARSPVPAEKPALPGRALLDERLIGVTDCFEDIKINYYE